MSRCTYNSGKGDLKVDKQSFEPTESRQDYIEVQMAVAEECLLPFGKSLYAALKRMLAMGAANIPQ